MSATGPVAAAILAGGDATDKVAGAGGAPCKALVEIGGRPLVSWVAAALQGARSVGPMVAVQGPTAPISAAGVTLGMPIATAEGPSFIDSMTAAVQAHPDAERLLLATGDLPMLTPQAVDGFVASCQDPQAELSYPLVHLEEFDDAFPGRAKSPVRLREGRFIGANLVMVSRRFVLEEGPVIARTFAERKSKLGMCRIFGWGFVLRLALGRLSVADLERRASEMLGVVARAVPAPWPEIAFDIDDADDLELARHCLRRRLEGV